MVTETEILVADRNRNGWHMPPSQILAVEDTYNGAVVRLAYPLQTPNGPTVELRLTRRQAGDLRQTLRVLRGGEGDAETTAEQREPAEPAEAVTNWPPADDLFGEHQYAQPVDVADLEPTPEPEPPTKPEPAEQPPAAKPITEADVLAALESVAGISSYRAGLVWKKYGERSLEVLADDPERVSRDIRGISLQMANRAAASLTRADEVSGEG